MALAREAVVPESARSAVTFRALVLGTFLTVMATIAGSYARFILHTTRLDQNHLSVAAVFPIDRARAFAPAQAESGRAYCHIYYGIDLRDYAHVFCREVDRQFYGAVLSGNARESVGDLL